MRLGQIDENTLGNTWLDDCTPSDLEGRLDLVGQGTLLRRSGPER